MGPATSGVTFRAGILSGIGDTITVVTVIFDQEGSAHIVDDDSYMPAGEHLISAYLFPIGRHNIFIGMTAEALGLRGETQFFPPTIHPIEEDFDAGIGFNLAHTYVGADQDLILAGRKAEETNPSCTSEVNTEYHYVSMVFTESTPATESSEPDSILPVINGKVDSKTGSENIATLDGDTDSDGEESVRQFASKVNGAFSGNHEVLMAAPTAAPACEEKEASKEASPPASDHNTSIANEWLLQNK